MPEHTDVTTYLETEVVSAARARGEPAWLRQRRAEAARAFEALPMPTPALRPWRYTDLAGFDFDAYPLGSAAVSVEGGVPGGGAFPPGYAGSLAGAAEREVVLAHFGSLVQATEGKFIAANAAQWQDGVLVHVPRGQAVATPLVVTFDASALEQAVVFPRLLVVAEEQSEATVVLRGLSGAAPLLSIGVIEVVAQQASRVRVLLDERWGEATREFSWLRAQLERDASLEVASVAIGGELIKQTAEVTLAGEGARSVIRAVALGDREQHFDFVTVQDHVGPRTASAVVVKSALAGASRSVYFGITRVGHEAAGADADQANYNLLLSGSSKADSDPVLEILTADVARCGHHATVGPVDREALFYLQSRGLDERPALQLLVSGFFQSVAGELPVPGLAEELEQRVVAKLEQAQL